MKFIIDATYPVNVDIIGEIAIRAEQPTAIGPLAACVEMRDLTGSMHARVRAPGTGGHDSLVGNNAQSLFDTLLNATPVLLTLPAIVGGTVIFDADGKSHVRVLPGAVKKMGSNRGFCSMESLTAGFYEKPRFDPIFF